MSRACPFSTKILLENLLRFEDGRTVSAADIDYVARGVAGAGSQGNQLHARPRPAAGFHRRPLRGRSGRHARCPGRHGRRSRAAPIRSCPPTWSSTTPCRWISFGTERRLRRQRPARIPAQPRALHAAALGPDRLPQFPRRAARHRHRPPGESGISRLGGLPRQIGRHGLSRLAWSAPIPTPP